MEFSGNFQDNIHTEAYSEASQAFKMELFARIVNGQKTLTIFAKFSVLDVWFSSEYRCLWYRWFKIYLANYIFLWVVLKFLSFLYSRSWESANSQVGKCLQGSALLEANCKFHIMYTLDKYQFNVIIENTREMYIEFVLL